MKIVIGTCLVGVVAAATLTALFVWPGYLRPIPRYGLMLSGDIDYILSKSHLDSIQIGMTLDEVQRALDVGEEKRPMDPWITNVAEAQRIQAKTGHSTLSLFESVKNSLPESGDAWFCVGCPGHHDLNLKVRQGKVVEKVVLWNDLQKMRERGRAWENLQQEKEPRS